MAWFDIVFEAGFPFNDDKCADFALGEILYGQDYFTQGMTGIVMGFGKRGLTYLSKGAPDVALENDYYDKKDWTQKGAEQPVEGQKLKLPGSEVENDQHKDAGQHLDCPGAADKENNAVDDKGDYKYIGKILPT